MRYIHPFVYAVSLAILVACDGGHVDSNELGLSALNDYCLYRGIKEDDFGQPRIYSDKRYDVVVEYTTKTNIAPRHVLLVYIKDGRIVERHSMIDEDE